MNFLKKLFGAKHNIANIEVNKNPENTRLNYLLDIYSQHSSNENYVAVMDEILSGNSYLLLPSVNDSDTSGEWVTLGPDSTLKLTSVFNLDGFKVLGAFSNEKSFLEWTKNHTTYTAFQTKDITNFCKENGISRIVINSGQKNMFVLEQNRENIKSTTIEKTTNVSVGAPAKPLDIQLIEKLISNFKKVDTIEEVYQYLQKMGDEFSIVLGIKMSIVSDNSRAAVQNAVTNSIENEKLELPLDIMFLETDSWLETVRGIDNALFYKR